MITHSIQLRCIEGKYQHSYRDASHLNFGCCLDRHSGILHHLCKLKTNLYLNKYIWKCSEIPAVDFAATDDLKIKIKWFKPFSLRFWKKLLLLRIFLVITTLVFLSWIVKYSIDPKIAHPLNDWCDTLFVLSCNEVSVKGGIHKSSEEFFPQHFLRQGHQLSPRAIC